MIYVDINECFKKRRAIRRFKDREIEGDKIKKIVEAVAYAPSAMGKNSAKLFIITNEAKRKALSKVRDYIEFLENAPLVIAVASDEKLSPAHFVEDASIAAFMIWLEAADLGLGACWGAIYKPGSQEREEKVRKILDIPNNYRIICLMGVGYPDEIPHKKALRKPKDIAETVR